MSEDALHPFPIKKYPKRKFKQKQQTQNNNK